MRFTEKDLKGIRSLLNWRKLGGARWFGWSADDVAELKEHGHPYILGAGRKLTVALLEIPGVATVGYNIPFKTPACGLEVRFYGPAQELTSAVKQVMQVLAEAKLLRAQPRKKAA